MSPAAVRRGLLHDRVEAYATDSELLAAIRGALPATVVPAFDQLVIEIRRAQW